MQLNLDININTEEGIKKLQMLEKALGAAEGTGSKATKSLGSGFSLLDTPIAAVTLKQLGLVKAIKATIDIVAELVKGGLDYAESLNKMSSNLGVTGQQLATLHVAAVQNASSVEEVNNSLQTMAVNLGKATDGTGETAKALHSMGLYSEQFFSLNPSQQFAEIAKSISSMSNQQDKLNAVAGIFGKEKGPQMLLILDQGEEGLRKAAEQAVQFGIALNDIEVKRLQDANDSIDSMKLAFTGLGAQLAETFAPVIQTIADLATKAANAVASLFDSEKERAEKRLKALKDNDPTYLLIEESKKLGQLQTTYDALKKSYELTIVTDTTAQAYRKKALEEANTQIQKQVDLLLKLSGVQEKATLAPIGGASKSPTSAQEYGEDMAKRITDAQSKYDTMMDSFVKTNKQKITDLFAEQLRIIQTAQDLNIGSAEQWAEARQQILLNMNKSLTEESEKEAEKEKEIKRDLYNFIKENDTNLIAARNRKAAYDIERQIDADSYTAEQQQTALLTKTYQERYDAINALKISETDKAILLEKLKQSYIKQTADVVEESARRQHDATAWYGQRALDIYSNLFGALANLATQGGKKYFQTMKWLARAQAVIDGARAVTAILADPTMPTYLKGAAIAAAAATVAAQLAKINQTQYGGGGSAGSSGTTLSSVGGGNGTSTGNLSNQNQSVSGSKGTTVINVIGNSTTSFTYDQVQSMLGQLSVAINEGDFILINQQSAQASLLTTRT